MAVLLALALQDVDALVARLGADDYEAREAAMAALRERGPDILDALRPHLAHRDAEIAARARVLAAEMELRRINELLVVEVCLERNGFRTTVTNRSSRSVVLRRAGWSVWVHYRDGSLGGRYGGRRSSGCNLRADDFFVLEPGATHDVETGTFVTHGEVDSVTAEYTYRVDAYVATCHRPCRHHGDPEKPWNRALDVDLKGSFDVREGE